MATQATDREYLEQLRVDLREIERLVASVIESDDLQAIEAVLDDIADLAQGEEEEDEA